MAANLRELMPHQVRGKQYLLDRGHGYLYMQMRLGKTLTTIRWVQEIVKPRPALRILVVAPLTVLHAWEGELFTEGERYVSAYGMPTNERAKLFNYYGRHILPERIWTLTNYESLRNYMDVATLPWDVVVLDESTRIKNPKAQVTQVCTEGFRGVPHRVALSGLPAPKSPLDLFCQFKFVDGRFMGFTNYYALRSRLFREPVTWYERGHIPLPGTEAKIHEYLHNEAFVLNRHDVNIGSPKIYEVRKVTLPPALMKEYYTALKTFQIDDNETQWRMVLEMWLSRFAGGFSPVGEPKHDRKFAELEYLISNELKGESVVVWFRFNQELMTASERLDKLGIGNVKITGMSSIAQRTADLDKFNNGQVPVMLAQVQCAKYGLNASVSSTAIYFSNPYSCEARLQSEDRILHPNKTEPLLYIDLVAAGTVDEKVVELLQAKVVDAKYFMREIVDWLHAVKETYGHAA